jgi:hypothetical protein
VASAGLDRVGYAAGFAEAGCDELIFAPGSASLDQITLLAEAIA